MRFTEATHKIEKRDVPFDREATSLSVKISRTPLRYWTLAPGEHECHIFSIMGLEEVGVFQAVRSTATLVLTIVRFPESSDYQTSFCKLLLDYALSYAANPPSSESPAILRGKVGIEIQTIKNTYISLNLPNDGLSIRSIMSGYGLFEKDNKTPTTSLPTLPIAHGG